MGDPWSIAGKVCLITGGTGGIGLAAARALAREGAELVLVGRERARGEAAVATIERETDGASVSFMSADLSSQADTRRFAEAFTARHPALHVLINNAGAMYGQRELSADGIEMTFALNHLGYFLLTHLLLDLLKASAPARIVVVASEAHQSAAADFTDVEAARRFDGWKAYCRTKLANLLFTYELARRLEGTGVTVNALHPGFVATDIGESHDFMKAFLWRFFTWFAHTPDIGARTVVDLATNPALAGVSGHFFEDGKERRSSEASYDQAAARDLWMLSERLTGI